MPILCERFLIDSACLLTIELKEKRIASIKRDPAKKMKFDAVANPKACVVLNSGSGKREQIIMTSVNASHSREYFS